MNKNEESDYCENHQSAYVNIKKEYNNWQSAMNITFQEYLKKIIENENTGEWAKEVALHLLNEKQNNLTTGLAP
jgi:hypothetical protein